MMLHFYNSRLKPGDLLTNSQIWVDYLSRVVHKELRVVQLRLFETLVPASNLQITVFQVSILLQN